MNKPVQDKSKEGWEVTAAESVFSTTKTRKYLYASPAAWLAATSDLTLSQIIQPIIMGKDVDRFLLEKAKRAARSSTFTLSSKMCPRPNC